MLSRFHHVSVHKCCSFQSLVHNQAKDAALRGSKPFIIILIIYSKVGPGALRQYGLHCQPGFKLRTPEMLQQEGSGGAWVGWNMLSLFELADTIDARLQRPADGVGKRIVQTNNSHSRSPERSPTRSVCNAACLRTGDCGVEKCRHDKTTGTTHQPAQLFFPPLHLSQCFGQYCVSSCARIMRIFTCS